MVSVNIYEDLYGRLKEFSKENNLTVKEAANMAIYSMIVGGHDNLGSLLLSMRKVKGEIKQ